MLLHNHTYLQKDSYLDIYAILHISADNNIRMGHARASLVLRQYYTQHHCMYTVSFTNINTWCRG